jgi:hypothetical protein
MTHHFAPNLMAKHHHNGRPTNLSIALDIAWNDILDHDHPFGSSRFAKYREKGGDYEKSKAFVIGFYAFFAWVAEKDRFPPMGEFGQNPSNELLKSALDVAYMTVDPADLWRAKNGFTKAGNLVDQMRKQFYRAGPRPETWSS